MILILLFSYQLPTSVAAAHPNIGQIAPILSTESMLAADHVHGAESSDWKVTLVTLLRIVEVFMAIVIVGWLSFRIIMWGEVRGNPPMLFSEQSERWLAICALLTFMLSGVIHVWIVAEEFSSFASTSLLDTMTTVLTSTILGRIAWIRPLLVGVLLALTFVPSRYRNRSAIVKSIVAIILVFTFPLTGHAFGISSGKFIAMISHLLHIVAGGIWFGGLFGLLVTTGRKHRVALTMNDTNAMIRRFSRIALPLMLMVITSGVILAVTRLYNWQQLFQTTYGQIIIVKSLLLLLVLVIAGFHRRIFMPRIEAASQRGEEEQTKAKRRFHNGVRIEISLAILLILFAGMLSSTSPPEEGITGEPIYWHVMGDQVHMSLRMDFKSATEQIIGLDIWLKAGEGEPQDVQVSVDNKAEKVVIPVALRSGGADPFGFEGFNKYSYNVQGEFLTEPGSWTFNVDFKDQAGNTYPYEKIFRIP